MSPAQRLLRWLYTCEAARHQGRPLQAGALCWRDGPEGIEILLVTSRSRGRWGVPKGWSLHGRRLARTAEREAWEEAGVIGRAENRLLALIPAPKSYRLAGAVDWLIAIYPLAVDELAAEWPEREQRQRQWFSPREAADLVRPKALADAIHAFSSATEQGQARRSRK